MKPCPKCKGAMKKGKELTSAGGVIGGMYPVKYTDSSTYTPASIVPYCCQNCGYIELYKERTVT